ncbi:MAG TPA: ATP-binding protein [Anaerolineae bacterium]|nr:ATP-binding protein [Anaerolineae bacterium]
MSMRMADRLSTARHQQFVGRAGERELFKSAVTADELPFQVLYIYGPGGVGKTTLLREFAWLCDETHAPAIYLDARNVDPAPEAFTNALRFALHLTPQDSLLQFLAAQPTRSIILIDTYETLAPLDNWLRESFLPQLPDNTLVVLAGRRLPSTDWRADPAWQTLIRPLPLRNLNPDESRAFLTRRSVPAVQHRAVLDFTHGHPLALSLVADVFAQRRDTQFQPEAAPDIVKTLLEQFVQKVPGPAHRAALEACAMVRLTTEALLAEMLGTSDAHELFEWLRGLSFIESDRQGLFPHDLAREALAADVRWRNPDWYAELHRRARNYFTARVQHTRGLEQQRVLFDLVFLHRDNPAVRPYIEWKESGSIFSDALQPGDEAAVIAIVAQHEGEASAQLAAYWLQRQPGGAIVFRDAEGRVAGFMSMVALQLVTPDDRRADPAVQAAVRYLERYAPLRPGESATLFRFWMARDDYQAVSPIQSLVFINAVRHYLTTPGLAFTFFPCADADFWATLFAYVDLPRLSEADFEVGGRRYGMYGHDWRTVPQVAWLALLAEREVASRAEYTPPPSAEPLIVLSESDFAAAVHNALRDFTRPDALRDNPIVRSRLIAERVGANADAAKRSAALQSLLKHTAESLQASPRDAKLYRALYHTYLQPASTQEQAAELLDLPFSTFRRHLKAGITRTTELLWQQEVGGPEK